ncbi:hypothetical protein GLOIN_2v1726684 [Rhizophagus irregularis DAOM 181602=DAOM 197198]|uniref:Uncharacterized protein n=1 Tax=Rhizophagus irregularis (strain DAOM 181602 / DAOM 197198 / MUCL 43194) TaxID=747089 RepID=A0A2P4P0J3_RHIID|nr:hypothetical protein GLOIN_2v1726684 [Rhizophagus irregularis DAOM 181602=DAOM 197198]POG58916.1 hypothetical protein GLOIN_2v1726684 [Rhizophagus irregularis DAOM 181602=DAOM 197198]|eukprot:XP_025165782.1 hypothetical protein GLOIN_2v1726684 [Rhizophagus irregularis DAOM 181602=DAOM 197198]
MLYYYYTILFLTIFNYCYISNLIFFLKKKVFKCYIYIRFVYNFLSIFVFLYVFFYKIVSSWLLVS